MKTISYSADLCVVGGGMAGLVAAISAAREGINVVLMHDTKSITVSALRNIIEFGVEYGYKFSAIDMNTYMVRHQVNNW